MSSKSTTIFNDLLGLLGVPHTADFSNSQFNAMPFKTLFGLQQLLKTYGVESEGYKFDDKSAMTRLQPPFVAQSGKGLVIVTGFDGNDVCYLSQGEKFKAPIKECEDAWTGVAFLAFPDERSKEPDYAVHRRNEIMVKLRNWGLTIGAVLLFAYLLISNGIYRSWSMIGVAVFDIVGLILTYMLLLKTLKIKSRAADSVCKVLQEGGCDHILETSASTFFGIFKWSEVGFAYFSVSLLTLLIFPQFTGYLALCNLCCLPYTVWSISYQKFVAKAWCTLCVSVQCTLWCLFFCYLGGGWLKEMFPLRIEFFVLGATYVTTLFALNKVLPYFSPREPK